LLTVPQAFETTQHISSSLTRPIGLGAITQMGQPAAAPRVGSEEEYRKDVCTKAAGLVDQYCVGAPDDRGVTSVQTWLQALGCTAVVAGAMAAPAGATGGYGK